MATDAKDFLSFVSHLSQTQFKAIAKTFNRRQLKAIREVVYNALHGSFEITDEDWEPLRNYKRVFQRIAYEGVTKCQVARHSKPLLHLLKITRGIIQSL